MQRKPDVQSRMRGIPPMTRTIQLAVWLSARRRSEKSGVLPPGANLEPITTSKP